MKVCQSLIHLATFIGLTASVCGQVAVNPSEASSTDALKDLKPGVVVEEVKKDSAADRAGLHVGDIILSWSRGNANGQVESPFGLSEVEIEQGPRGPVALEGIRGTEKQSWVVPPNTWDLKTRPNVSGHLLELHQQAASAAGTETWESEVERAVVSDAATTDYPRWLSAWFWLQSAEILARKEQWDKADRACRLAVQRTASSGSPLAALVLKKCGDAFYPADDSTQSQKYYEEALAESEKDGPMSLRTASIQSNLGRLLFSLDDLPREEQLLHRAIAIHRQLVPGSLALAFHLNRLGVYLQKSGDTDQSARLLEECIVIREKMIPNSRALAQTLENLGDTFNLRGDLDQAEIYLKRALELWKKLDPEGLSLAGALVDMSVNLSERGDLARAELFFRRALAIQKKIDPQGGGVAASLNGLGLIFQHRSQLAEAEELFKQCLALRAPGSLLAASHIENLGEVARDRGDLPEAERWLRQAIAIREKLAPKSLELGVAYLAMGDLELERNNVAAAGDRYRQALAIEEDVAPEGHEIADTIKRLGDVAGRNGEGTSAEQYYLRAIQLEERLASSGMAYAEALFALANLRHHTGQREEAGSLFAQALTALENQTARLGGAADVHSGFRTRFDAYYRDYVDLLIMQKRPDRAFEVLERSRARSLLEMLAEAHVDIHKGVDPGLLELEHNLQGDIAAKINRRVNLLTGKHTEDQVVAVSKEISELVSKYQEAEGEIRISSPGYAALTQPQRLNTRQVQDLLDPDTLLLEYCLGEQRSYVWAVSAGSLAVHEIAKRAEVEEVARRLYQLLAVWDESHAGLTPAEDENQRKIRFQETAALLSRMVLGPVARELQGKRLLIVSDGALQYVPFAALPGPDEGPLKKTDRNRNWVPLAAEHEIVSLPSASVLAVLRADQAGRKQASKAVAVFADPVFDKKDERVGKSTQGRPDDSRTSSEAGRVPDRLARSMADMDVRGTGELYLPRLSFTRQEARAILAVTPKGQALEALDFDANRAQATSPELVQYRIVHIATHGLLDSKHPELSGLVLSMVDRQGGLQDGFLGLQDIYNLNLPVSLVVLSACQTGLGQEIQGEGLVGLTRGFMYAGASRVVASLWKADDAATAELMGRFYKAMEKDGMRPAAALRQAQVQMWKQKRWADPYFWAGFQIQGEWK